MKSAAAAIIPGDAVAAGDQLDYNVAYISGMRDNLRILEVALSCN